LIKNLFFIFDILGKKNVIYLLILVPVVLLSIILEFFSIFSFLPLIMQSLGENDISSNYYLSKLSRLLISYFDNINFFFIFVLCVIATKNIYLLFQQYFFLTVTKKIYLFICDKMFVSRLSEKYLTFIDKSSSNFLKDIRETSSVFRLYLESLINFLTEIIISIVIVVFLFLINFNVSSIIFLTFGLILYLFLSFSKGYSQRTGQNQNQAVEQINDILLNSYHNFVDIRLYRQIDFFKKKFLAINSIYAECIKKLNFLFSIPKSTIELMIVTFLILFFFNFQEINFKDHIGILGIYLVELKKIIESKNINYNSILKENASTFSGGQRQRIAIARALYRDTDILILDEATNALDLDSEKRIIKNLHSIKKNKIIIIISHRKETKKSCDISYDLSK
jgi:ABC-type bacteriocin/lantibiotic exporter with double-glycine peptidase domain